ncbi:MAG: DUF721 domain-containing protein [Devosia nanyangense]|uniref:DUF721 domain-containing protein n=1 Tax=Devosia nanyangense TaxID=1228055 RepID=A0A933L2Q3_9HYPH|nr:DUF721 domain-containing protein [Devosia nanyangense]
MASKPKEPSEPRRLNRTVGVGEALSGVLDSALKKRGFATKDILTHWAAMAPKPYDLVAVPDRLQWPRGAGHEGATLYLRCSQGHALALSHEGPLVAAAVNRYFGYFLVREVRLSIEPFRPRSVAKTEARVTLPEVAQHAGDAVAEVGDPALKDALKGLGEAVFGQRKH